MLQSLFATGCKQVWPLAAHCNACYACRVFGSGGQDTRPPEGVLKGFTKCASKTAAITNSVKTIANTDYAIGPHG